MLIYQLTNIFSTTNAENHKNVVQNIGAIVQYNNLKLVYCVCMSTYHDCFT